KLDRVRLVPKSVAERRADPERGFWPRLARTIMRRPIVFASLTAAVLLAAASPVFKLQLTPGSNKGVPQHLESVRGLNVLTAAVGAGATAPTNIVGDTGLAGGVNDPGVQAGIRRLTGALSNDQEVERAEFDRQGDP